MFTDRTTFFFFNDQSLFKIAPKINMQRYAHTYICVHKGKEPQWVVPGQVSLIFTDLIDFFPLTRMKCVFDITFFLPDTSVIVKYKNNFSK